MEYFDELLRVQSIEEDHWTLLEGLNFQWKLATDRQEVSPVMRPVTVKRLILDLHGLFLPSPEEMKYPRGGPGERQAGFHAADANANRYRCITELSTVRCFAINFPARPLEPAPAG